MLPESFAGFPKSVAEERSDRQSDGSLWKPRDALINLLRDIDEGKLNAESMVICYREKNDKGESFSRYVMACPDMIVALGLLSRIMWRLNDPEG